MRVIDIPDLVSGKTYIEIFSQQGWQTDKELYHGTLESLYGSVIYGEILTEKIEKIIPIALDSYEAGLTIIINI